MDHSNSEPSLLEDELKKMRHSIPTYYFTRMRCFALKLATTGDLI